MGALANLPVPLESITCAQCGVEFAMPRHLLNLRRNSAGEVHCPSGHITCWTESEAQRLKKVLDAKEAELVRAREQRADAIHARDVQTERAAKAEKKLARAKNGVCPCCRRTFVALQRHMKTKHPEWKP